MNDQYDIQFVPHRQLDLIKWDNCIGSAGNGLIYAYSYYLDHMARNWDALVWGDYRAVMPLTWNSKFGIHYLYQPFLTAQLGIFGNELSGDLVNAFLQKVPSRFRYWDLYFNHGNIFHLKDYRLYQRKNFVLDLDRSYEKLYTGYRENIRRNIRRSEQLGCKPIIDFDVEKLISLAVEQMRTYTKESADNTDRFRKLYHYLHSRQQAITYGILSPQDQLIASCVFVFSHNRAYYLLVGNHPDGRTLGASHSLIDSFIKDHAEKKMLLDFEGSDIRNLAFFYSSFGAREEDYAAIKVNRLPVLLRWAKR